LAGLKSVVGLRLIRHIRYRAGRNVYQRSND